MLHKFCQYFKPVSISLSPNKEKDDILLALKLLFKPWQWQSQKPAIAGNSDRRLENEFKSYLGLKNAISFNSGRSALMAILHGLKNGDPFLAKGLEGREILLQAFTCNATANPIIWSGFKPVYVDCNEQTFNINTYDLRKKITPNTKAVLVQHTFGIPANIDEILNICSQYNLILIEDCAH